MVCDWKDIRSVTALLIVYTLLSSTYQVLKGVAVLVSSLKVGRYQREIRVYGGVEWSVIGRDMGGYWSVAEVIVTQLHTLGKSRAIVSLGAASVPRQRDLPRKRRLLLGL